VRPARPQRDEDGAGPAAARDQAAEAVERDGGGEQAHPGDGQEPDEPGIEREEGDVAHASGVRRRHRGDERVVPRLGETEQFGCVVGVQPREAVDAEVVGKDDEHREPEEPDLGVHGDRRKGFVEEPAASSAHVAADGTEDDTVLRRPGG
jgi:hypothetical protein